jgi:multidrug efflux pump subunit AcrA (membrane-fusion protein)
MIVTIEGEDVMPIKLTRQPIEQKVINDAEFTGNTAPLESVALRTRVRGFLKSLNRTPGSEVKKGDLLFVIEPEPYQVKVDQAKAEGIV